MVGLGRGIVRSLVLTTLSMDALLVNLAAITKYHRLGDLNKINLYHRSGGWKSEIRVHGCILVRTLFLAYRWLSSCPILTCQRDQAPFSSYKETNPILGALPL